MKKIAIILSGCGNRDGSELQETLSLLLAIDRRGWQYQCFAPKGEFTPVSYISNNELRNRRDIFEESARIARGNILPLASYNESDYDALALPGGMGAARNLSTYAFDGTDMEVLPLVASAILATHRAGKPVAAMCIAPIVLANVLGHEGVELTFGGDSAAADHATEMGAVVVPCLPEQAHADTAHKVITTPAYMSATNISQIFDGAQALVDKLAEML